VQRTIRILRVGLLIVGIAFIVLIVLSWRTGRRGKEKVPSTGVTSTIRPFDPAASEAKTFEDTQTIGGRVVSRIRARRVIAFKSGWNTLEDVQLTIYRPTGLTYELVCPQAQFNSNTKESEAKGGVKVVSSDGVEITTAEIKFDGNHLTNHVAVNFRIDRWTGSGGALDLDVQAEMLHLFEKVDATAQPAEPGELPMNLKAQDGVFRRKENNVDFTKDVVYTHGDDRVVCDHMAARFTPDRKTLSGLDGNGHVIIVMGVASQIAGNASGRKELTCDRFWSELGPTGQINALNTAGDTALAHAVIEGPPKRDIVARTFRAALTNKVVTDLKADGEIVMKELGPVPRDVTTDHLVVYFDAATHKATNAAMEGNVHYRDPRNDAKTVRATYDIVNDLVILTATPGFNPTVVSDGNILKATTIELSPRAQSARAQGDVIAQLVSKGGGPAADTTNLFPAGKPVFVNSDQLVIRQAAKLAVFSGNVRAWQETNTMFAAEMQVQGQGDQVTARGGVRTILYNTSSSGEARKTPMLTHSDTLVAHKNERRIELTGNVKIDDETRHMTGEKATFFLDASKRIEHIEAEQKVVLIDTATSRKATGDKATYFVNRRMVYVFGNPATATAPNGTLTAQQISIDLVRNKVEVVSPTSPTQGTYKPQP
jgi:lipopolysaccharide export system protein LptA